MDHSLQTKLESIEKYIQAQTLNKKECLTLAEAAVFAGVSKSYLYKLTSTHQIPFYRPATKLIYFKREELISWLLSHRECSQLEITENGIEQFTSKNRKNGRN